MNVIKCFPLGSNPTFSTLPEPIEYLFQSDALNLPCSTIPPSSTKWILDPRNTKNSNPVERLDTPGRYRCIAEFSNGKRMISQSVEVTHPCMHYIFHRIDT